MASASPSPSPSKTVRTAGSLLDRSKWESLHDDAGRVVHSTVVRKLVFEGGIEQSLRKEVWRFLLGYHSFTTTTRERAVIESERRIEYLARRQRWKELLEPDDQAHAMSLATLEGDDQFQFMFIQATMNAARQDIDEDDARKEIRTIDKDVPRTDRRVDYYSGDNNVHLQWLRNILITYSLFHPQVGYTQGMNDILSVILFVMDDEADAYWCFVNYIETIKEDFMSKGMMRKIELLRELLVYMNAPLAHHLKAIDDGNLVFCHRWLLLSFKREFAFVDAVRMFEILSTHHLELNGLEAERAREMEIRAEREKEMSRSDGIPCEIVERTGPNLSFTFDLFVCIAILTMNETTLLHCKDVAGIYQFANEVVESLNLDVVLNKSIELLFTYCRKCVTNPDSAFLSVPTDFTHS
eukprot:m.153958 g.153958  ORF g.153958 m.153958 type:complete len:410 (+) comp52874_c1_seq2:150-1379(+)